MEVKDLVIKRSFNAPRQKVWDAWTKPELVKSWWGPKGFTTPFAKIDFKVGGKYLVSMRSPEGVDYWSTGEYQEIKPLERIVYSDSFSDKDGSIVPAAEQGMPGDWPDRLMVTLTFEDAGPGKTALTLSTAGIPDDKNRDLTRESWGSMLDKLANCLK